MTLEDSIVIAAALSQQQNNHHPISISYNNNTDSWVETWEGPLGIFTKTYTLKVQNKGTENETVTGIIFPDGSEMTITGF